MNTSVEALRSIDEPKLEDMVYAAIAEYGQNGCTASNLLNEKFEGFAYSSITARFAALERSGRILCGPDKRKGDSGRNQRVMRAF